MNGYLCLAVVLRVALAFASHAGEAKHGLPADPLPTDEHIRSILGSETEIPELCRSAYDKIKGYLKGNTKPFQAFQLMASSWDQIVQLAGGAPNVISPEPLYTGKPTEEQELVLQQALQHGDEYRRIFAQFHWDKKALTGFCVRFGMFIANFESELKQVHCMSYAKVNGALVVCNEFLRSPRKPRALL